MNTKEDFKVSIVVPIYGVEPFLDKLIVSIMHQTYHNMEVLLVDDGSPDKCGEICDKYALLDNRIRVFHTENKGGCEARNIGIDNAIGDYLMFIDGDDWIAEDCVEYLLNLAISTNSEMAFSKFNFTNFDTIQTEDAGKVEIWTPEESVVAIFLPMFSVGCWNKIYKTDLIRRNKLRFDIPWYGEGLYFSSMAAAYSNRVGVGNKKVYYYRKDNPTSATTVRSLANVRNAIWNSSNLRKVIPIRTARTRWAIDQHIMKNYYEALTALYALKKIDDNYLFYLSCKAGLLFYSLMAIYEGKCVLGDVYSPVEWHNILRRCLSPMRYIKRDLAWERTCKIQLK